MSAPARTLRAAVRRPTGDVPILPALVAAVPLYGLTILGARNAPRYVEELLLERGWVPHAILVLTSIALAILGAKAAALRSQRRAFAVDLVPSEVVADDAPIGQVEAAEALRHVDATRLARAKRRAAPSLLLERARRVLDGFAARGDVAEATALSTADAETDAVSFASSLSTVKVLVWAIPILGFIGTVIGISDAVAGFSRSLDGAEQIDLIKTSLGDVTSGLAVAFDTTLVALVASIVVMLPTSWIQKADEALVADVDEAITTHLLRRLGAAPGLAPEADPIEATPATAADPAGAIAVAVTALAEAHQELVRRAAEERAAAAASHAAVALQIGRLAEVARTLGPAVERAVAQLDQVSTRVDAAGSQLVRAVHQLELATSLTERSAATTGDTHEQLARELGASRQLLALLAAGLGAPGEAGPRANGRRSGNGNGHGASAVHAEE